MRADRRPSRLTFAVLLSIVTVVATFALARGTLTASAAPAARPRGKLLFVLTTGLEDVQMVGMSLRHAKMAKESGHLESVVWLTYGRGVQSLSPMGARPPKLAQLAREAQAAGVPLIACNTALTQMGVPKESLDPKPQIVPAGIIKLSELVSQGYQIIRY